MERTKRERERQQIDFFLDFSLFDCRRTAQVFILVFIVGEVVLHMGKRKRSYR